MDLKLKEYDVVVFGGGMVGAAAALGFAAKGAKLAIVEPLLPKEIAPSAPPDLRVSAISYGSQELLESLGAWQNLQHSRIQPYTKLAVWEHIQMATEFSAEDVALPCLGYLLENTNLQLALHQSLAEYQDQVTWYQRGTLECARQGRCVLDGHAIQTKLIVAADGGFSTLRKATKMGETGWQYQQSVFTIGIQTESPSLDKTFQQFSKNGPMAYLPLFDNYAALVWYTHPQHIERLKSYSTLQLKSEIERYFPALHSDFKVLNSASFPIRRNHANHYFRDNVVLCGDAAHAINPLAGQGVNIGFQDVKSLIGIDLNRELSAQLKDYEAQRKPRNLLMMTAMDVFNVAFSNANPLLQIGRNLGLKLANHAGPLKQMALRQALGL